MWPVHHCLTIFSRVLPEKLTGSHLVEKFPAFFVPRMFITAFTSLGHLSPSWARPRVPLPLLASCQRTRLSPRSCETLRNIVSFEGEELLAPRPKSKLENHPPSAVRGCLFYIFAATVHIWRSFPQSQPENASYWNDRHPLTEGAPFPTEFKVHWLIMSTVKWNTNTPGSSYKTGPYKCPAKGFDTWQLKNSHWTDLHTESREN